ncbi:hypothetical protein KAH94_06580, partial [bacterium]|nr:hypothetical protein [bacterium]
VSSFQLEQCKKFAPTLAIWTNFSPNHLDRHETEKNYFAAKKKIIDNQHKGQHAIVPLCLKKLFNFCGKITPSLTFFSFNPEWKNEFANCLRVANVVYVKNNSLMRHNYNKEVKELNLSNIFNALPSITFRENLLIISLALDLIGKLLNKPIIFKKNTPIALPPHRLEYVATINKVSFYNDSKSTTSASTIAAVKKCADKPVLLLLGGLSKGADRFELVKKIKPYIKKVYAFGAEEEILKKALIQNNVSYQSFFSLDEAFSSCFADAQADDQILLSPAGSSFDLFKNYEERGNYFKKLVLQLKQ